MVDKTICKNCDSAFGWEFNFEERTFVCRNCGKEYYWSEFLELEHLPNLRPKMIYKGEEQ